MVLYATERIDDAVSLTRSLLLPIDAWLWLKLAVVLFFVGLGSGGSGTVNVGTNVPSAASAGGTLPGFTFDPGSVVVSERVVVLAAVVVGGFLLVGLVAASLGAVMEFVLVAALRDQALQLRQRVRQYARRGLWLFGFRLLLGLVALVVIGGTAALLFWAEFTALLSAEPIRFTAASVISRALLIGGVAMLVGIPLFAVHGLTTEFVVPVMVKHDEGIRAGWRRFWPRFTGQFRQYGAYLLVAIALRIGTSIAAGVIIGTVAVIALLLFGILGVIFGFGAIAAGSAIVGIAVLVVLFGLFALVVLFLSAVVYIPVTAFHRYHALLVMGDTDDELDILGELRPGLDEPFTVDNG